MSVVKGHDRLVGAAKQLLAEWQALKEVWRDENSRQFEEKYIIPLESEARAAVMAMDRAQAAIHRAQRDCADAKGADL
jgi:hypothetical protein